MTFYNKKINWNFYSEKQNKLNNREIYYPRGKVLEDLALLMAWSMQEG